MCESEKEVLCCNLLLVKEITMMMIVLLAIEGTGRQTASGLDPVRLCQYGQDH